MKNILIGILTILCGALGYMQFGMPQPTQEPCPVCEEAVVEEEVAEAEPEKLSTDQVITLAEINGISLQTPIDEVDEKLENAGYSCSKNDNTATSEDQTSRVVSWKCEHNTLYRTVFTLNASKGELQTLSRAGSATEKEVEEMIDQVSQLRVKMASREGVSLSQTENITKFLINYTAEGQKPFVLNYRLQLNPSQDPENPDEKVGILKAHISR